MINQLRELLSQGPVSVKEAQAITGVKSGHILAAIAKHHGFVTDRTQKPIMISLKDVPHAPEPTPQITITEDTFTRDFFLDVRKRMATSSNRVIQGTTLEDLEIDTKIDLTPYPTVSLEVRKPDRTEETWPATFLNSDPTTQILVHTFQPGDLDQAGDFLIHAKLEDGTGVIRYSSMGVLRCVALFDNPNS